MVPISRSLQDFDSVGTVVSPASVARAGASSSTLRYGSGRPPRAPSPTGGGGGGRQSPRKSPGHRSRRGGGVGRAGGELGDLSNVSAGGGERPPPPLDPSASDGARAVAAPLCPLTCKTLVEPAILLVDGFTYVRTHA